MNRRIAAQAAGTALVFAAMLSVFVLALQAGR